MDSYIYLYRLFFLCIFFFFFFQAEDGIRDLYVTGVQTCALPIYPAIFTRWADTLVADGQPLVRPRESTRFDYEGELAIDRKSTRLNSSHVEISYAVFCLKKKKKKKKNRHKSKQMRTGNIQLISFK